MREHRRAAPTKGPFLPPVRNSSRSASPPENTIRSIIVRMNVAANVVAAFHIAYFLFIIGGLAGILLARRQKWSWPHNLWFRATHLLSVWIVIIEEVFGFPCPLNVAENSLRASSATPPTGADRLFDQLLRNTIPGDVLDIMYFTLGPLLIALWFLVRPRRA